MADVKIMNTASSKEITIYFWDLTDRLPGGVTVASCTGTHTPPSGTAVTPTYAVSSPEVQITVPAMSVIGVHLIESVATLSDGEKASLMLVIPVKW